jgi:NAD-dependent dihydropyrimidine dehydrogenase PreA subunit
MDISIDQARCTEPETCARCLQVCAPQVFVIHPQETNVLVPQRWVISPIWTGLCIGCFRCVQECPHQAIDIE